MGQRGRQNIIFDHLPDTLRWKGFRVERPFISAKVGHSRPDSVISNRFINLLLAADNNRQLPYHLSNALHEWIAGINKLFSSENHCCRCYIYFLALFCVPSPQTMKDPSTPIDKKHNLDHTPTYYCYSYTL